MIQVQPLVTGIPAQTISQVLIRVGAFETDATSTQLYFAGMTSGSTATIVDDGNLMLTGATFVNFLNSSGTTITDIENYTLNYLGLTRL